MYHALVCVFNKHFSCLFQQCIVHAFLTICDPASQNQQKVAWPSFVLWLEIGDQGQHG